MSRPRTPRRGDPQPKPYRGGFRLQHSVPVDGVPTRFTETAPTARECIAKRDARRDIHADPDRAAAAAMTVADLLDVWFAVARRDVEAKTIAGYRLGMAHIKRHPIAGRRVVELRASHVKDLLLDEAAAGFGKWTIVKVRSTLNMALTHALGDDLIRVNPARGLRTPSKGVKRPGRMTALTLDESAKLIAHLVEQHSTANAALLVMLMCGLRPGEAIGLLWQNVRLRDGELDVRTSLRRQGTGNGDHIVDELKTSHLSERPEDDAGWRTIKIPPVLARVLKRERDEQLARGVRPWVFADAAGEHHCSGWLWKPIKSAVQALRLPDISPNELRHTFGSLMLAAGLPEAEVAALMGHRDTTMLRRNYEHRTTTSDTSIAFGAVAM